MKTLIPILMTVFMTSCGWGEAYETTKVIVESYPSDNVAEEFVEDVAESYFDMEEGSFDITPFSPEN